jgi:hypothetical protein
VTAPAAKRKSILVLRHRTSPIDPTRVSGDSKRKITG